MPFIEGPEKRQTSLQYCYSFVIKKHSNYITKILRIEIKFCMALYWSDSWRFSDFSWFMRLHSAQFGYNDGANYGTIGNFPHPCERLGPFILLYWLPGPD